MEKKTVTLRFRAESALQKRLMQLAKKRHCDASAILREGIYHFLESEEQRLGIRRAESQPAA